MRAGWLLFIFLLGAAVAVIITQPDVRPDGTPVNPCPTVSRSR